MKTATGSNFYKEAPQKIHQDARRFSNSNVYHNQALGHKFEDTPLPSSATK